MKPVKILTRFTEEFAQLWTQMTFENPEEQLKTNTYRLAPEYCKRPHHPPMVYLRLPENTRPEDLVGKLVNIVITEGPNASGKYIITKILVFVADKATTPKYETHVVGFSWGKSDPGYKVHSPSLKDERRIGSDVSIAGNFDIIHLDLRSYSSSGRTWYDLHVIFKVPGQTVTITDYWHGMNKEMKNNTYQI